MTIWMRYTLLLNTLSAELARISSSWWKPSFAHEASMRFAQTRVGIRRPSIFIEATSPSGHAQLMTLARCESALSAVLANSKWSRRA